MSRGESERRRLLKENFMEVRGHLNSIEEIAKYFKVSTWTVYQALDEIALEQNLKREDLLFEPGKGNFGGKNGSTRKNQIVDIDALNTDFDNLLEEVDVILKRIETILQMQEEK